MRSAHKTKILCVALLLGQASGALADRELDEGLRRYEAAVQESEFVEAELAAKLLIDRAAQKQDGAGPELSELLAMLAFAQRNSGDYDAARQNYELAILTVQQSGNNLDPSLAPLYVDLGLAHLAGDRPDLALTALNQSLHVVHVNAGPHSTEQLAALHAMVDSHYRIGDVEQAVDVADRIFWLQQRRLVEGDVAEVDVLLERAAVLHKIGQYEAERTALRDALRSLDKFHEVDLGRKIDGLLAMSKSYIVESYAKPPDSNADQELVEAASISAGKALVEADELLQRIELDWQRHAEVTLAIADYLTMAGKEGNARQKYEEVWALLTESEERMPLRREYLEQVVPIVQPRPEYQIFDSLPEDAALVKGFLVASFTVDRHGQLTDIGLLESGPRRDPATEQIILRALNRFVYRPRMQNGFVADTPNQTFRFEFPMLDQASVAK